jgi:PhoPQ-activated pathogenicity-related protein
MVIPVMQRIILTFCAALALSLSAHGGALEKYVQAPDSAFGWKKRGSQQTNGVTVTQVDFTSQKWRDSVWTHTVQIVRPAKVRNPDIAFLFVTGDGSGSRNLPMLQTLAERAGAMAAVITRVPNQPLYDGRKEDALIAYTFDQYLKTKDETWPLLFPMVKSAVRAMDAVQEFAKQEHKEQIKRFVVSGASKRGWTTWLTGATDPRVKGIAPMVIDMLNMRAQVKWADKVYGKQSEEISDYTDLGLIARIDDPDMVRLRDWVDPYAYRNRYKMPKLILIGTNDPYWTVDSLRHYFDDLPGPKLIYQTPNAGHDLGGGKEATQTLAAFFQMIADNQPLPKMDWDIKESKLALKINQPAKAALLWTADSADRDFRNDRWSSRPLSIQSGSSRASAEIEKPQTGYRAYLGEVMLSSPTGHDYKLSTEARVTPDNIK